MYKGIGFTYTFSAHMAKLQMQALGLEEEYYVEPHCLEASINEPRIT